MKEKEFVIQQMPAPTFRWLKMNESKVEIPEEVFPYSLSIGGVEKEKGIKKESVSSPFSGSMSTEMDDYFREEHLPVDRYVVEKNTVHPDFLRISLENGKHPVEHSAQEFTLEEGAKLKLFFHLASVEEKGISILQEKFHLQKDAELELVIAAKEEKDFKALQDFSFVLEDKAKLKLTSLLFSGQSHSLSYRIDLKGKKAETELNLAYMLSEKEKADFNLVVNHFGEKTLSNIVSDGVLRKDAVKIFRGTIDLKHGAKGASGTEQENVLLMDDNVVNQTIPVILCDEDDVEGNHGATIGRLDEEILFYMESRGISLEAAYELIAEARMESAIHGIKDSEIEAFIESEIRGKSSEGEE